MKIKKTPFKTELEITMEEIHDAMYKLPPESKLYILLVNYLKKTLK